MSDIAPVEEPLFDSQLVRWAMDARQAHQIAQSLAKTSFVPKSFQGKPDDVTAAILAGQELGLKPMAALRSMDIIQGTPALRAHAMRGLLQSQGHSIQLVESTMTRCVMKGKRKGEESWQQVTWTLERAKQLGLTGKSEWQKQAQTMLVARATGEVCRLVAADALYAMPYTAEELGDDLPLSIVGLTAEAAPKKARRTPLAIAPDPELLPPDEAQPEPEPTGDTPPDPDLNEEWPETAKPADAS
jgi:hypothetical protein